MNTNSGYGVGDGRGSSNGVIRVGRKGRKKFAFGEADPSNPDAGVFEVDVVEAWQQWLKIDEGFRERSDDRVIPVVDMAEYHLAAVAFAMHASKGVVTDLSIAEALDFIARLREQYDEVADFFQVRPREERGSPDSSAVELRFSVDPALES